MKWKNGLGADCYAPFHSDVRASKTEGAVGTHISHKYM